MPNSFPISKLKLRIIFCPDVGNFNFDAGIEFGIPKTYNLTTHTYVFQKHFLTCFFCTSVLG